MKVSPGDPTSAIWRPAPFEGLPPNSTSSTLDDYLDDIMAGRIVSVAWPWPALTQNTFSLLPGSVVLVTGNPGVGKTFLLLQCLQFWAAAGHKTAILFGEKNVRFYEHRLLAQLEGNGNFVDYDWVPRNGSIVRTAAAKHRGTIAQLSKSFSIMDREAVSLDNCRGWIRTQARDGARVIVVDPITAVGAGETRWNEDLDFMKGVQKECEHYGASLILSTHPRKGKIVGGPTGHDVAGGASFFRLADTAIWINRLKNPKKVQYVSPCGLATNNFTTFWHLQKTRDGRGAGSEIAFTFGDGMKFTEHGVVVKEIKESETESSVHLEQLG